jgi:uncharacterized protein (TIGR02996 family)
MTYAAHPDYRALLLSVLESPADDLPRLVLADWLEEHDEPERARRIRFMCAHPRKWFRILYDLEHGVRAGLDEYTDQWVEADDDWSLGPAGAGWRGIYWHRGFVAGVRFSLADWYRVDTGPVVVRLHPIEHVRATDRRPMRYDPGQAEPLAVVPVFRDGFWWLDAGPTGGSPDITGELPTEIHRLLLGYDGEVRGGGAKRYPTEEVAVAALSSALRRWAHGTAPPFRPA